MKDTCARCVRFHPLDSKTTKAGVIGTLGRGECRNGDQAARVPLSVLANCGVQELAPGVAAGATLVLGQGAGQILVSPSDPACDQFEASEEANA